MVLNFAFFEIKLNRNPYRILFTFRRTPLWFHKDYKKFVSLMGNDKTFPVRENMPCIDDKGMDAGDTIPIYFPQDLYVAQKVFQNNPVKHVDVGSRVDGFVAHVASFRNIELLDIRKMDSSIQNVEFKQADLMDSETIPLDYCDSISSLHALEHFGLGRYGDKLDPNGHKKGFENITRMLKSGGTFYFSVPMGVQRIDFNAHRVFSLSYLLDWVNKDYDIVSFAYISDRGVLYEDVVINEELIRTSCGCRFGCAIFELRKK